MKLPTPTKLTLRLDSALIDRAKGYALEQDRSLSQLVADYFLRLADQPKAAGKGKATSAVIGPAAGPVTTRLRGALRRPGDRAAGAKAPLSRADHRAHLEEKYR